MRQLKDFIKYKSGFRTYLLHAAEPFLRS